VKALYTTRFLLVKRFFENFFLLFLLRCYYTTLFAVCQALFFKIYNFSFVPFWKFPHIISPSNRKK
ncbi:MAG TPA: hypothetical protein DDW30_00275, partial [Clostridiales bacterium]|nr:hypothetical protein [Clostridiales bacterium]